MESIFRGKLSAGPADQSTGVRSIIANSPACCIGKTVIERNHFERWRPTLRGYESRRQLQCIGSTQRVTKKPYRCR
jgi:hypothetical protein